MLTIAIDCGDQLRKGHAALTGDLLQTVPELVFEADARLMACNDNRALRNRRISDRYYMAAWPFGQENPRLGATRGFPAEAVSPSAVWSRVTCRGYAGLGTARIIATCGRIAIGTALEPFATRRRCNWASRLFACQQHALDHAYIMSMQSAEL